MMVEKIPFGTARDGSAVHLFRLHGADGMEVELLDYGCTIRAIRIPRGGEMLDVCLGYDTIEGYESNEGYLGAVVGRYANRIGKGMLRVGEDTYTLACNDGPNHLHGGMRGFDKYVWDSCVLENGVEFSRLSADGEENYPGALQVRVRMELDGQGCLQLTYKAVCDRDTVVNLTNHCYFNLAGEGNILSHTLQLDASHFTENDPFCLPTGTILPVENTPFDFTSPKPIGRDMDADCVQLKNGKGYDHNFILDGLDGLKRAAVLCAPSTGISMQVYTTMPGVQFYAGNVLNTTDGKQGRRYAPHDGLCLETQYFPDAPSHPNFPSALLKAGEEYHHVTRFCFSW